MTDFLIIVFFSFSLFCSSSLYVLDMNMFFVGVTCIVGIFSQSMACLLALYMGTYKIRFLSFSMLPRERSIQHCSGFPAYLKGTFSQCPELLMSSNSLHQEPP